jgi:hypothetical protein
LLTNPSGPRGDAAGTVAASAAAPAAEAAAVATKTVTPDAATAADPAASPQGPEHEIQSTLIFRIPNIEYRKSIPPTVPEYPIPQPNIESSVNNFKLPKRKVQSQPSGPKLVPQPRASGRQPRA